MSVNFKNVIYRFRNADALLDEFHELENQEIYFSPYADLNDPCEGRLNLYWEGDAILWRNLLKHYYVTFVHTWIGMTLGMDDYRELNMFVDLKRYLVSNQLEDFFSSRITEWVLRYMVLRKKMYEEELTVLLRMVHRSATSVLMKHMQPEQQVVISLDNEMELPIIEEFVNGHSEEELEQVYRHMELYMVHVGEKFCSKEGDERSAFFLIEFPKEYIRGLSQLLYPNWYVACFCSSCMDARMWANYAGNHKGACLIFKTKEESEKIAVRLRTCHSWSSDVGAIYEYHWETLHKMNYTDEFQAINFFEMLGNVPGGLIEHWYQDENSEESAYSFRKNEEAWREQYWKHFHGFVTSKSKDWSGEEEVRVVLTDDLLMRFSTVEKRKVRYEFSELYGIVFGSRMSAENKQKVRKIIAEKCKAENRTDFKLFEEQFNRATRKIELIQIA